jgi:hypothetical protein
LKACDWFLVIMSPRSVGSEWVLAEVHWAMENRTGRVIPVLLEDCDRAEFHLWIPRLQYIDFRQDRASARESLISVIRDEGGPQSKKETPPPVVDPEFLTTRVGQIKLKRIPAGMFMMGSPGEEGESDEHPQHEVRITRPFYLGVFEVTQGRFQAVMARTRVGSQDRMTCRSNKSPGWTL